LTIILALSFAELGKAQTISGSECSRPTTISTKEWNLLSSEAQAAACRAQTSTPRSAWRKKPSNWNSMNAREQELWLHEHEEVPAPSVERELDSQTRLIEKPANWNTLNAAEQSYWLKFGTLPAVSIRPSEAPSPPQPRQERWWERVLTALAAVAQAYADGPSTSLRPFAALSGPKIMLFGGGNHKTYLGCLSCPEDAQDSIFNERGQFGHCAGPFSDNLFCRGPFKEFGSTGPFQDLSACATSASNPPVIVDEKGSYYGRFSVGGLFGHDDSACATIGRFKSNSVCEIVKWVCEQ
jgi:hypothetical protein